jgi:hypothetical protein
VRNIRSASAISRESLAFIGGDVLFCPLSQEGGRRFAVERSRTTSEIAWRNVARCLTRKGSGSWSDCRTALLSGHSQRLFTIF